jgi:hypothetical protein
MGTTTNREALAHLRRYATGKAARPDRLCRDGEAYFCGAEGGPVKIGFSKDPEERLYRLQTSHPERLHLWATAEGGEQAERDYHRQFADHRINGEWFQRCPEIEAEIDRLKALQDIAGTCANNRGTSVHIPYKGCAA